MSGDAVRDGRHLMEQDEDGELYRANIWRQTWNAACWLSRPRMPRHYFDGDGRLHVTLPQRFRPEQDAAAIGQIPQG